MRSGGARGSGGPGGAVTAFTSANLDYLDRALVLLRSLRVHQPDWPLVLVLVDELPPAGHPAAAGLAEALRAFDEVLLARDLPVGPFRPWVFGHDAVEACTAVKGPALVELLARPGTDVVVYLDPDMALTAPLAPALAGLSGLAGASALLTPHQLEPEDAPVAVVDNEMGSLRTGVYNLGFLAVRDCPEGRALAAWWSARLRRYCVDDPSRGLFTDQRWMDLAPVFFPGVGVLRDPGVNLASWNLGRRPVTVDRRGRYLAGGSPLRLVHFTKARTVGPTMTLRYSLDSLRVHELWRWYLAELDAAGAGLAPPGWAYGAYTSGTPVPTAHRRLYREREDLRAAFPDPFDSRRTPSCEGWMDAHAAGG